MQSKTSTWQGAPGAAQHGSAALACLGFPLPDACGCA